MRPTNIGIVRDGKPVPLELTPMTDPPDDGLEHWSSATDLRTGDNLKIEHLTSGVAIHFPGCVVVRPPDGGAVYLIGQPGTINEVRDSD
ncbi:hypothetical protein [Mycolicibacterium mageritense]|uniref:hypothetical protein n=1 Tax=Mycolicibacterium mageritense TaxID=53462 RepID=UPI001E56BC89|nr:hypothetical protein [Mycolicibacterium mageritense]MCC9181126.1 hypothetical protein [Mycolicibacterium mageritense]